MPFQASWIKERLQKAADEQRLAHAYLLTGEDLGQMESLFNELAAIILGSTQLDHPDKHVIRPESKSRRLTVEQIRDLEHELQLKSRQAPLKIAAIIAADRMCLGQAEAANAFLKTLEEPPAHSIIFLLTDRPEQLLPTIKSRCLCLSLQNETDSEKAPDMPWLRDWIETKGSPADQAYRRAVLLSEAWRDCREQIEDRYKARLKEEPDTAPALLEAEFLVARDLSIQILIRRVWQAADSLEAKQKAVSCCEGLEELRYALSRNLDQNMALERCSLRISGLIDG